MSPRRNASAGRASAGGPRGGSGRARRGPRPGVQSPVIFGARIGAGGTFIHPRDLLRHLHMSPRQSMGQNFLVNEDYLKAIVARAVIREGDRVLEIGPGLGALTWQLVHAGAQVTAVEKDRGLAAFLREQYETHPQVTVVESDILDWDLSQLEGPGQDPWRVVANLPYNVAIPILFHLLERPLGFRDLHLMVQREVAERMMAAPNTEPYGVLSVTLQLVATVSEVLEVPPAAFYPAQKVQSTVVRVVPLEEPRCAVGSQAMMERVVKAAFGRRRNILRNALLGSGFSPEVADGAFLAAAVDGKRRGETLSVDDFCALSRALMDAQR